MAWVSRHFNLAFFSALQLIFVALSSLVLSFKKFSYIASRAGRVFIRSERPPCRSSDGLNGFNHRGNSQENSQGLEKVKASGKQNKTVRYFVVPHVSFYLSLRGDAPASTWQSNELPDLKLLRGLKSSCEAGKGVVTVEAQQDE